MRKLCCVPYSKFNLALMLFNSFQILDGNIQSAAFHPVYDNVFAVGMTTGRWVVIESGNREVICSNTDGPEQLDIIRYSPGS